MFAPLGLLTAAGAWGGTSAALGSPRCGGQRPQPTPPQRVVLPSPPWGSLAGDEWFEACRNSAFGALPVKCRRKQPWKLVEVRLLCYLFACKPLQVESSLCCWVLEMDGDDVHC